MQCSLTEQEIITLLFIDAAPLKYNAMFTDRTGNNSLNSTIIYTQKKLIGMEQEIVHKKIFKLDHNSLMRK